MSKPTINKQQTDEATLREEIVLVGKLLYDKGLIVATDGNISARLGQNRILITPSGLCKGLLKPEQLIVVDLSGQKVGPETAANRHLIPTSETAMHLQAYQQRPDMAAVVHAHPPHAIALTIVGISLANCMLPEAVIFLGLTPTVPYSTPASVENAHAIKDAITGHDALMLERHGSLTVGNTPMEALQRTETLEQLARIMHLVQQVGGGESLPQYEVEKLLGIRAKFGLNRTADHEDMNRFYKSKIEALSG